MSAGGTTLVIDDEEVVRHLVRRMLEPELCQLTDLIMPKPFTVENLRETIEPLLARSREQRRQSEAARRRALDRWATTVDLVAAANARRRRHPSGESPR